MWGRKQRRIDELEEKLRAAIEDQVTVQVHMPQDVVTTVQQLPKGIWYRVSYMFRVATEYNGVEYSGAFVGTQPVPYFDGEISGLDAESPEYDWEGGGAS